MTTLRAPRPASAGLFLTYKCNSTCKHCMYACSPHWPTDWISEEDAERILAQLAKTMPHQSFSPGQVNLNEGLHLTGGEPFLNFDLLLRLTKMAVGMGFPSIFVETNGFWCRDDADSLDQLRSLQDAGLNGIMVSANPFLLEQIPFERTQRAARISQQVFGHNAFVYQRFFFQQFQELGLRESLPFEEYLRVGGHGLRYVELIPNGRVPFHMGYLFEPRPASQYFGANCQGDLLREWHVHIDNYCNYMPGFCGGLSWGDARELDALCQGIELDDRPVLKALLSDLEDLYRMGLDLGYQERDGYISKCHLCIDIRRHLARTGEFRELTPLAFYERLED